MGNRNNRSWRRKRKRIFYGIQRYAVNSAKKPRLNNDTTESEAVTIDNPVTEQSTSTETDPTILSASARKIGIQNPQIETQSKPNVTGYRFIDMELLGELFTQMLCQECENSSLVLEDEQRERKGSASHLRVRCEDCGWVYAFYTSKRVQRSFEINRRFVYAMRSIGQGHASMERFCYHMNMPPPLSTAAYTATNAALSKTAKSVAMKSMEDAAKELHQENSNSITQCGVSCDGTWQRRGYSSLNGCVTTLSMDTGKCLDIEILTKLCLGCQRIEKETDASKKADMVAKHQCKSNYQGSAPSMETEGIKRIFGRSEETRKLQYTEYFGDGDSKAYNEVENVYENIHVEKRECVGHVQKRLGVALQKLKKETKGIGGKGKLTDSLINKLQNYYGTAIRSNSGNLEGMRRSIHASLFHCASSERQNLHDHCPDGPGSWCQYKKDLVNNTHKYKPGPGIPDNIIELVKPIYARLSSDNLLKKCLDCKTQNQNESLNSMIWNRVPKSVCVGADVLQFGAYDAVAHFNMGSTAAVKIISELGLDPGEFFERGVAKADKKRITKANHNNTPAAKKRRKVLRGRKKKKEDNAKEEEGTTYEAGAF